MTFEAAAIAGWPLKLGHHDTNLLLYSVYKDNYNMGYHERLNRAIIPLNLHNSASAKCANWAPAVPNSAAELTTAQKAMTVATGTITVAKGTITVAKGTSTAEMETTVCLLMVHAKRAVLRD